jgi:hypothetical protein
MLEEVKKLANGNDFDVIVCDFLMPAVNMPEKIKVPIVLFQHNVEAMIWRRHFEVQKNALKKKYLKNQWRKSFDYEKAVCGKFDFVIAVSKEDADTMRNEYAVEKRSDVPTGVDTKFFQPNLTVEKDPFNLIFTGSMDWLPNEDAISWFTEEVLPLIKREIPQSFAYCRRAQSVSESRRIEPKRFFNRRHRKSAGCSSVYGKSKRLYCADQDWRRHASEDL